MRTKFCTLLSTTSLGIMLAAFSASPAMAGNVGKWAPQIEIEGKAGTSGRRLAYPKFMAPLWQNDNTLVFTDLRIKADNQDSQEYNIGLGWRTKLDKDWALGGYGFFDRMRSDSEHLYSQGTFGLEAISADNDIRMNIYVPETTKHAAPGNATLVISGGQASVQGGFERALHGADFEIGQKIPVNFADLRAYAGGYSFTADDFESVTGPRGRIELKVNDEYLPEIPFGAELTFGAEYQRDDVRGEEAFGLVKLSVPLWGSENKSKLTPLEKRMNNFIQRDVDIVASNGGTEEAIINGIGVDEFVHISDGDSFVDEVNAAGENALILVDGTVASGTGTAYMEDGQIITGGGATVSVVGAKTGVTFNHTFSESAGTVNSTGNGAPLLYLPSNVTVSDITIENSGGSAMFGGGDNIKLENLTINDSGNYGIDLDTGITNLTVTNVIIDGTVNDGFNIDGGSNITINGLEVYDAGDEAIELSNVDEVDLIDAVVDNAHEYGISFAAATDIFIDGAEVDGAGGDGIIFWGTNSQIAIQNTNVSNTTGNGIEVAGVSNLTIDDSTTEDTGDSGIHISGNTNNTFLTDITVSNSGAYGIDFNGTNNNVSVSGITINGYDDDGFNIDDGEILNIDDITVTGTGDEGIEINSVDDVTVNDAHVTNAGDIGIAFSSSTDITLTNSSSTNSTSRGIYIGGAGVDAEISDTTITNSAAQGLDIQITSGSIELNDSTISGSVSNAIELDGATATLSGSGNTLSGNASDCSSAGATITGNISYNGASTCP